jgi:hypothetical protein
VSANLDLVRSIYAAWEHGDYSSAEWAHPEIEYMLVDGPAPFSRSGLSGLAEGWREFLSAWEDFRVENVEYRQLDSERVLMLDLLSVRGATDRPVFTGSIRSRARTSRPRSSSPETTAA